MKSNEITLRIKGNIEKFIEDLKKKGYKETEHFILYDTYMIPEILDIEKLSTRQIISKAIIIRKVEDIFYNSIRRDMAYKIKKINDKGEIVEQKSIKLKINDCEEAEKFMKVLGYKKIMNIVEEDYEYTKEEFKIITKDVKNGDKMIEVETQINNEKFDSIDKLKNILKEEKFDLDYTDFFVKKAEVELDKLLNRKK